tara:strand:- start:502 stop:750 length:249 start_codon:yes stop_codon:yes gene_type:complete
MRSEKKITSALILIMIFSIIFFQTKTQNTEKPSFSIFNTNIENQMEIENLIDFYLEERGYSLDSNKINSLRQKNNFFWNKNE